MELSKLTKNDKVKLLNSLLQEMGFNVSLNDLKGYEAPAEDLTKLNGFSLKKQVFIAAYKKSFGNVTQSCMAAKVERGTYYYWRHSDKDFADYIDNIEPNEDKLDFLESKLISKVKDGDTAAIIFGLKTLGKKRGYIERQEITTPPNEETVHYYLPDNARDGYRVEDIDHEEIKSNGKSNHKADK